VKNTRIFFFQQLIPNNYPPTSGSTVDSCKNFITYLHGTTQRTCIPSARMLFPGWGRSKNTLVGGEVQSPSPSLRGFTLIELILVLVIIGFLTSLVAPAITSSTGLRLKTTVRRLAAGLRFARSQAVITGNTYQVIFDVENGTMAIEPIEKETPYVRAEYEEGSWDTEEEDAEEEGRALKRRQEKKIYKMPEDVTLAKVLLDGEEISEGQVWIEFYPNGSCSGGDVFVMDTKERTYRIALEFLTGIVTIREEEEL
jgi:type II secretion system protein H